MFMLKIVLLVCVCIYVYILFVNCNRLWALSLPCLLV